MRKLKLFDEIFKTFFKKAQQTAQGSYFSIYLFLVLIIFKMYILNIIPFIEYLRYDQILKKYEIF